MRISKAAFDLIVAEEVTDKKTYERKYRQPEWPGGQSGLTIGIGYDVGYATVDRLTKDWSGHIPAAMIGALSQACGVKGEDAKELTAQLKHMADIPWDAAMAVFAQVDVPRWEKVVSDNLPNTDKLSADCFGALVSLAYNRGPSFYKPGPRYAEMRAIKEHMSNGDFEDIPDEIRAMRRLWPTMKGLRDRRDREAALFERGLKVSASPMPAPVPPVLPPDVGPIPKPAPQANPIVAILTAIFNAIFKRK